MIDKVYHYLNFFLYFYHHLIRVNFINLIYLTVFMSLMDKIHYVGEGIKSLAYKPVNLIDYDRQGFD